MFDTIFDDLKDDYLQRPFSKEDWIELDDQTYKKLQFSNVYVIADGQKIASFHPFHSGLDIHNYKAFFSIVLRTLVVLVL